MANIINCYQQKRNITKKIKTIDNILVERKLVFKLKIFYTFAAGKSV
jgi:hypothetical protein